MSEEQFVICPFCNHLNENEALFCNRCGANINPSVNDHMITEALEPVIAEGDEAFDITPSRDLSSGEAELVIKKGPDVGTRFKIDREITVAGRHPESDIFLDDITVSRKHAEITRLEDGSFRIVDLGSLNGTCLNKERIDMAKLKNGDEVQIGKYRLLFYYFSK